MKFDIWRGPEEKEVKTHLFKQSALATESNKPSYYLDRATPIVQQLQPDRKSKWKEFDTNNGLHLMLFYIVNLLFFHFPFSAHPFQNDSCCKQLQLENVVKMFLIILSYL